jgi:Ca2+-dependent lipid-binding protein
MAKRNEADTGSLAFKERTLSKAAAKELFDTRSASALGGIINTTVVRIKHAKTTKAAKATDEYFAYGAAKNVHAGRGLRTSAPSGKFTIFRGKTHEKV